MTAQPTQEPTSLADVIDTWQRTLHMPEPGALLVALGAIVANLMEGDPLWLMLVGPPSSGKTEIVEAFSELSWVHMVSTVTKAGLLAGSPSKDGTGGLLMELGERGVIVFKDFTTLLSEHASTRNEVFGILREVHDGKVSRVLGTRGGQTPKWRGQAGAIACVTDAVDQFEMAALGERWLRYRLGPLEPPDRFLAGLSAFANRSKQRSNREARRLVVESFLSGLVIEAEPPTLSDAAVDRLITLADLGTRCRSAVPRGGGHGDEISQVLPPEEVPRLMVALSRLSAGLSVIGVDYTTRWAILAKCALDGIHSLRRRVLDVLVDTDAELSTATVAGHCAVPQTSTRRHLEELTARASSGNAGLCPRGCKSAGGRPLAQRAPVMADGAPLIYAAHPMTTYGTPREARALARLVELVPHADIIDPAIRYASNDEWQADWPKLLPQLAAVVVFGDRGGAIGTGCLHELVDAWWRGIPVGMLDGSGQCRHVAGIRVLSSRVRTGRRTGLLVPGPRCTPPPV